MDHNHNGQPGAVDMRPVMLSVAEGEAIVASINVAHAIGAIPAENWQDAHSALHKVLASRVYPKAGPGVATVVRFPGPGRTQ